MKQFIIEELIGKKWYFRGEYDTKGLPKELNDFIQSCRTGEYTRIPKTNLRVGIK